MSRPIYEPSLPRTDAQLGYGSRQLFRRPSPLGGGNICPTFYATIADGTGGREYFDDADTLDTVFWTDWVNGDPAVFDPNIQPSGSEAGKVGAVELLVEGNYLIRARIDWDDNFAGEIRIGANYDDSNIVTKLHETANAWYGPDGLTEYRYLNFNTQCGSDEQVEIVVGQTNPGGTPRTIPGGTDGFWAMCPELAITYLCGHGLGEGS